MKTTIKFKIVALIAIIGFAVTSCATFGIGPKLPPPENITVTQTVSPRTITVTWDAVEGATEYEVQIVGLVRRTVKGTTFTLTSDSNNTVIAPARDYDVRVAANKRAIEGNRSPAVSILTLPATPAERLPVPADVTATANSWNSITIRWGASTGATGYRITQGANTWTATGTSHTVTDLNGDTNYSFVVTPLINNEAGTSARAVSVRTPLSPQQQAAADQRARDQAARAAAAEREREAEAARITALNNNANFQRLRGEWTKQQDYIIFPDDANSDVRASHSGASPIIGKLQTITANEIIVGDTRAGFTFNYTLSGNVLTISNFRVGLLGSWRAADLYNGEYRKR